MGKRIATDGLDHYVSNKDLLRELKYYNETGEITDELSIMIFKICDRFGSKHNWCGYTYKDDMVADAYIKVSQSIHKFNMTYKSDILFKCKECGQTTLQHLDNKKTCMNKDCDYVSYDNPFAYFTSIISNQFLKFHNNEVYEDEVKWKSLYMQNEAYKVANDGMELEMPPEVKQRIQKYSGK
ncbi:hypothetical protein [uncultured Arcobacter sp.]|uniref:hypothetical protein n=1 Tax=uncultured Arcobacter sp. TaxID=165434 RepID=UPI0026367374|nr:hypothetical protein [uncultured Arcobacter sp.]